MVTTYGVIVVDSKARKTIHFYSNYTENISGTHFIGKECNKFETCVIVFAMNWGIKDCNLYPLSF